jgi:hypothetical protein
MTHYEHIKGNKYLKTCIFYEEGKGYYLSIYLVDRYDRGNGVFIESLGAYSWLKTCLFETKIQSNKSYETAISMSEDKVDKLKIDVLSINGMGSKNKFSWAKR